MSRPKQPKPAKDPRPPAKELVSYRLSQATQEKLTALAKRYGTKTTALEVAIDRLYQQEMAKG